jgi:hypothetical protein
MGTSGILHLLLHSKKSLQQLLLFILLCLMLAVLPGKVKAQPTVILDGIYSNSTDGFTGYLMNWGPFPVTCAGDVTIECFSLTGQGSPVLEYNVGNGWIQLTPPTSVSEMVGSMSQIELRLTVTGLPNVESVTLTGGFVWEKMSVSWVAANTHNISCHGANDGALEVAAHCGKSGSFTYSWSKSGVPFSSDPGISGLSPDNYRVEVSNGGIDPTVILDYTLNEPDSLYFSVSGKNWSCPSSVGCNGSISISPVGGTPPYNYTIDGASTPNPINSLCGYQGAGRTYNLNITDANNCTTAGSQPFVITTDSTAPNCTTYPQDYPYDIGGSTPPSGTWGQIFSDNTISYIGGDTNDTLIFPVNAQNYNNIQLRVTASQSGEDDWTGSEFLQVGVDINGGTNFTQVVSDYCKWEGNPNETGGGSNCSGETSPTPTSWITLTGAEGRSINVRIVFNSQSPHNYVINSFIVQGRKLSSAINPSFSGQPDICTDNFSSATPTYTDGVINWICNVSPDNYEFWFTRHWSITDGCNNIQSYDQKISVGTPPTLTLPRDTILDYCHNTNATIIGPTGSDLCDGSLTTTWAVTKNETNVVPQTGTGNTAVINYFPRPVVSDDTTYVITWTVTDDAGFSKNGSLNVQIEKPMKITLTPVNANFCSGTLAIFNLAVSGGTGKYLNLVPGAIFGGAVTISPNGTWTSSGNHSSGTYETSNLDYGGTNAINIAYTDTLNGNIAGGCTLLQTITSGGDIFTVHQKIPTNPINRVSP